MRRTVTALGVTVSGLDFSGDYDFAPTEMYWPINHKVAPAKEALTGPEYHRDNGRLHWKALGEQTHMGDFVLGFPCGLCAYAGTNAFLEWH